MDESTLARVEAQRLELEENVAKLRKSLRHWQTLEIDYEGLKEEFQGLPEDTPHEDCLQAAKDFKPELVDEKELHSLFEDKRRGFKRPSQLVDVLSKRVDYVTRNVATIRKQLSDAEKKRNALLLAQDPDHQDEAALPLSEITEELDEDGKIISSKVQNPGKEAPDLLDVLRKAGVPDIKHSETDVLQTPTTSDKHADNNDATNTSKPANTNAEPNSLKLQDDRIEELPGDEDVSDEDGKLGPTNPDDTEEDAALRQEMLRYGMDEVGAIVAELDLGDAGDYTDDENDLDDYLSDYDEDEDLYIDESEDEKGATKNPVISDRYRRQMEALSKKHGITDMENLGPESELPADVKKQLDRPSAREAARKAAIARDEAVKSALKSTENEDGTVNEPKKKKKKVGFAPSLDIAQEVPPSSAATTTEPVVNPVGDLIVERNTSNTDVSAPPPLSTQPPTTTPKKISRFKATRSAEPQTPMFPPPKMDFPPTSTSKSTPEGPAGRTIADTLVERPRSRISTPADPNDFDEELHRREVAIEYQKMRNRKIHEQGGYVRGGQAEDYGEEVAPPEEVDENTGKPKKISRFKAARMKS